MSVHKKVECKQRKEDCFAYRGKYCIVLNNSTFNHECPFYKTGEQFADGLKKYPVKEEQE